MQGLLAAVLFLVASADKASCPAKAKDKPLEGSALLMREKTMTKQKNLEAKDVHALNSYGPRKSGKAVEYFMKWAAGSIENKVNRELLKNLNVITDASLVQEESSEESAVRAASLLEAAELEKCGRSLSSQRAWSLLEKVDKSGVEHLVIRSKNSASKLQYLALQHDKIILADPPVACMMENPDITRDTSSDAGRNSLLDPKDDQLVQDCIKLFRRTAADICQKKMEVKVSHATMHIIDGFEVHMDAEVTGPLGKTTLHHPSCRFEVSLDHTDAKLLQEETKNTTTGTDAAESDPTEAEKSGLKATLTMQTPLCKADEQDGTGSTTSLMQNFAMGELSVYKGYEHVNDDLQKIKVPLSQGAPTEVDLRKSFPSCFPEKDGKEVVRNQGQCGSCWAFASASAAMNNLCTSDHAQLSLKNKDDRYEISVQQIMSCNEQQVGCNGGYAAAAHSGIMKTQGPSKERDYVYQCGSGDPLNHFDASSATCSSFPWGANCVDKSATPGWMWSGVAEVNGENSMKSLIADGQSLYVSMTVYANFFDVKDDVYTATSGSAKGGHAMAGMGYGTQGGTPYWLLQNSWGPDSWGVEGYGKVLRGQNLAGVETGAYWLKAWVEGGKQPECADGESTGFTAGGNAIPCSDAKGSYYGDMCANYQTVRTNCPKTCDSCLVVGTPSGGKGAPAPRPPPIQTPAPTPPPPPPPRKKDSCVADATSKFRGAYSCVVQSKCARKVTVKCPACSMVLPGAGYYLPKCDGSVQTGACDGTCHVYGS